MNQDVKVSFTVPGVYVVTCRPYTAMGMVVVIVVGEPVNLGRIKWQTHRQGQGQTREAPCHSEVNVTTARTGEGGVHDLGRRCRPLNAVSLPSLF